MSTITRVKFVSSLWKEITPLCDVPFDVFHAKVQSDRDGFHFPLLTRLMVSTFASTMLRPR